MPKIERHRRIREIVRARSVGNQEQLLLALRAENFPVNQSTLSRDLRELGIRKIDGRYEVAAKRSGESTHFDLSPAVRSWTVCGPHLVVLRTHTGQAQAIGVAIDAADDPSITGTLSGDDTLFLATAGRRQQAVALRRLTTWFGEKEA